MIRVKDATTFISSRGECVVLCGEARTCRGSAGSGLVAYARLVDLDALGDIDEIEPYRKIPCYECGDDIDDIFSAVVMRYLRGATLRKTVILHADCYAARIANGLVNVAPEYWG